MPYVNDGGKVSQIQEETAISQAKFEAARYACRCPRRDRFGLVRGHDDHYGIFINAVVYPFVGRLTQKREKKLKGVDVCKVHPDEEFKP